MRAQPKKWRDRSYRIVGNYKLVRTTDCGSGCRGVSVKRSGKLIHTSWADDPQYDFQVLGYLTETYSLPVGVILTIGLMLGWDKQVG